MFQLEKKGFGFKQISYYLWYLAGFGSIKDRGLVLSFVTCVSHCLFLSSWIAFASIYLFTKDPGWADFLCGIFFLTERAAL